MKKAQRFLALTGMSLAAGAMIGMGPAQAAPAAGQSSTGGSTAGRAFGEHVVGYYRTEWACERAGFTGKRFHAWWDYDCDPINYGWRGWVFQLVVDDDDWQWNDWRGTWPGGWPYRPDFAGQTFHVRGPHGRPGFPNRGPFDDRNGSRGDDDRNGPWDDRGGPRGDDDRNGPRGNDDRNGPRGDDDRNGPRGNDDRNGPRGNDDRNGPRGDDDRNGPRGNDDRNGPRGNDDRNGPPRDNDHPPTWPKP
ncbi:hypothetical protein [Actinoplanes sp. NPDC020271]|uniref:hypothetical protein n=1 Tax=Actinoplanes sp. NPDC020271 TaxID=3363896 RepID=UPI0037B03263